MRFRLSICLITAVTALCAGPAMAEMYRGEDDNTRAVRIIEAPPDSPLPSAPGLAPPPDAMPNSPPVALPPIPAWPPTANAPPRPALEAPQTERPADYLVPRKQAALGAIPLDPKVANTAELAIELLPGVDVALGTKFSFRVSTKKPGYLILVDVDAEGKLTQIFPVPNNVVGGRAPGLKSNYVAPGKPLTIPSAGDGLAGIEYVAAPPTGVAMVVAILSDKPVQIIDLPDVPTALTGQAEALALLTKLAKELRITAGGRLQEARWSFDAKFYAIR